MQDTVSGWQLGATAGTTGPKHCGREDEDDVAQHIIIVGTTARVQFLGVRHVTHVTCSCHGAWFESERDKIPFAVLYQPRRCSKNQKNLDNLPNSRCLCGSLPLLPYEPSV